MARRAALVGNAADEGQLADAERKTKELQELADQDLREILKTPGGRRFVRRLLVETCGILKSTYTQNITGRGSDPTYLEGRRDIGRQLLAEIRRIDYKLWLVAEAEHLERIEKGEVAE